MNSLYIFVFILYQVTVAIVPVILRCIVVDLRKIAKVCACIIYFICHIRELIAVAQL